MGKNSIKFDMSGFRDLEKELEKDFAEYSAEANKAADRESSPEGKARAYARVMKRHGIDLNVRELTKKFKGLMNE